MTQIFHHYKNWECFKNGMWRKESPRYEETHLPEIISFTGDHKLYGLAMMEVVVSWPVTCEHHLTVNSLNRRAFVGHAACCFKFGWPEYLVRRAWNLLSKQQQQDANKKADEAIHYFIKSINA